MQKAANEALNLATDHNMQFYISLVNHHRGWALALQDQAEKGIALMRRYLTDALSSEHYSIALWTVALVEACEYGGFVDEGLDFAEEGLQAYEKTDGGIFKAELYRLKGELLLQQKNQTQEAEACFQLALKTASDQSAKSYELRTAISFARFLCSQTRREEARDLLQPVYSWFTEGFDTPDLLEANSLLKELS